MNNDSKPENQGDKDSKLPVEQDKPVDASSKDSATTDSRDGTNKPGNARPATSTKKSGAAVLGRLLLLVIVLGMLVAAGWFGWQWLQQQRAGYDAQLAAQAETVARLENTLNRAIETRVAQEEFTALREQLDDTRSQLGDRVESIANDMESLREAAQGGRRELAFAEIEYLLRIAADELYLTQDVATAIYALQAADDRLQQLADPRLNPVRQLIADHLQALGAVSVPDTSGMALKLGSLMRQVPELPLRQSQHARAVDDIAAAAPEDAGWWVRAKRGVSRLFDKLVVVQRAEPPAPLLKPEEHFFLYRNVELQLAAARAALLAGDIAAYRQSLELAREWLNRYFDQNDAAVANVVADITGLLAVSLQPELPEITVALERFRAITENRGRGVGAR